MRALTSATATGHGVRAGTGRRPVSGGPAAVGITLKQGEPWTGELGFSTVVRKPKPAGHVVVALPVGVTDVAVDRAIIEGADVDNVIVPRLEQTPATVNDHPTAKVVAVPANPELPSGAVARVGDTVATLVRFKWKLPSYPAGYERYQSQVAFDARDRATRSGGVLNLPPLGQYLDNKSYKPREGAFATFALELQQPYSLLPGLSPPVASSFGSSAWATGDGTVGAEYVTFGWEDLRGRSGYATRMRFMYLGLGLLAGAAAGKWYTEARG